MRERPMTPPAGELKKKENKINKNTSTADQNETDSQKIYRKEVDRYKLLTREEELDLAKRMIQGDNEARELLINSNLRLVIYLAHKLTDDKNLLPDLIQTGNMGLIRATKTFDPTRGVRFTSYAADWIIKNMSQYIRDNRSLIKIGTTQVQRKIFSNLNKIIRKLEHEGTEPSDEMIAERMNSPEVTAEEIQSMRQRLKPVQSMDAPLKSKENSFTLNDILRSSDPSPEDTIQKSQITKYLREATDSTTDKRERAIIENRLLSDNPKTFEELGKEFGVSRQAIEQTATKIKKKLAGILKAKGLKLEDLE